MWELSGSREIEINGGRRREEYHREFYTPLVIEKNTAVSTPTIIKETPTITEQVEDRPTQVIFAVSKPIQASRIGKWKTPVKPIKYNTVLATSKPIISEFRKEEWIMVEKKGKKKLMEDVKTPVNPTLKDYLSNKRTVNQSK